MKQNNGAILDSPESIAYFENEAKRLGIKKDEPITLTAHIIEKRIPSKLQQWIYCAFRIKLGKWPGELIDDGRSKPQSKLKCGVDD